MRVLVVPSLGRRLASMAIDGAVIACLWAVLLRFGGFGTDLAHRAPTDLDAWSRDLGLVRAWAGALACLLLYLGAMGALGTSLGKLACGLSVVHSDGQALTPIRGTVRGLLAALGTALDGVSPAFVLVSRRQRALHDLLTGSFVVVRAAKGGSPRPPARKGQSEPRSAGTRPKAR